MSAYYFWLVLCACASIGYATRTEYMKTKGDFIKTCEAKDPQFMACSTETLKLLYEQLKIGIDDLEGIVLDPVKLSKLQLLSDDGPVSLNMTINRGVVKGFSDIVVIENTVSPKTFHWKEKHYLPKLRIEGHYRLQGRILVLPLVGSGSFWFEPSGVHLTVNARTHLYEKFGHIFFNVTGINVQLEMTGMKLRLNNLFDGSNLLEESTNQYLNENWKALSETLKPLIEKAMEDYFFKSYNTIFEYVPADYFISDIKHPSELYG